MFGGGHQGLKLRVETLGLLGWLGLGVELNIRKVSQTKYIIINTQLEMVSKTLMKEKEKVNVTDGDEHIYFYRITICAWLTTETSIKCTFNYNDNFIHLYLHTHF